jgi:FMN-dependent NADH-azoreductase
MSTVKIQGNETASPIGDLPVNNNTLNILQLNSSGRRDESLTRTLSNDLISALEDRHGAANIVRRDLDSNPAFVNAAWIEANFTPDEQKTQQHNETLAYSNELVSELMNADTIVIGAPIYNFSIAASLKAWIDMVARARLTFRYTENGPVGLLQGKKAYIVVASGGVPVGSAVDFATPYLRHALAFLGITDVDIIAADKYNTDADESLDRARATIAELVHLRDGQKTTEAA